MPILDPRHDLAHPVEGDTAWSESYYFNAFDPGSDSGFFTRIGIRPNEGTMDIGLSVWLPGGDLAEYRHVVPQTQMVDSVLEVGDARYEMLEPLTAWRITADADVPARPCTRNAADADPARTVHLGLDVRFDALTPAIGTDGQASGTGPTSAQSAAAAGSTGKGHLEQAGRWTGWLEVDGTKHEWSAATDPADPATPAAHGNRDKSWGPRRWGGPTMWRWFSINVGPDMHFGGIRLGTPAGDLHRGWVWHNGRATSVAEWGVRTDLADDDVTHKVVHLTVRDKKDRTYALRGDVLRVADIGRAGGTMVNEGLAKWTYAPDPDPDPDHDAADAETLARTGYGICEYLHQLDDGGRPVVPVE